jgi:hypothetical protein
MRDIFLGCKDIAIFDSRAVFDLQDCWLAGEVAAPPVVLSDRSLPVAKRVRSPIM